MRGLNGSMKSSSKRSFVSNRTGIREEEEWLLVLLISITSMVEVGVVVVLVGVVA